jgi:hypothetical protein
MNNNNKLIALGVVVLLVSGGLMAWSSNASKGPKGPGELDGFAQCLTERGATFYGAFWCPHCKDQKAMFGNSEQYLPYVECSTPDGRGQTPICKQAGITSYPTWVFADGATSTGTLSLETLAERTGCVLPGAASPAAL